MTYRYQCPNCKSHKLLVSVTVMARLHQSPTDPDDIQTEIEDQDHEWDSDDSVMVCHSCGKVGQAYSFNTEDKQ